MTNTNDNHRITNEVIQMQKELNVVLTELCRINTYLQEFSSTRKLDTGTKELIDYIEVKVNNMIIPNLMSAMRIIQEDA